MQKPIDDGGPAFPCNSPNGKETHPGMSLRDWFAGMAMQGMLAVSSVQSTLTHDAIRGGTKTSFEIADAMLAAGKEKPGEG